MKKELFISRYRPYEYQLDVFKKDLDSVIQDEIEKRMPNEAEVIHESKNRFRRSTISRANIENEAFIYAYDWLKSKIMKK